MGLLHTGTGKGRGDSVEEKDEEYGGKGRKENWGKQRNLNCSGRKRMAELGDGHEKREGQSEKVEGKAWATTQHSIFQNF